MNKLTELISDERVESNLTLENNTMHKTKTKPTSSSFQLAIETADLSLLTEIYNEDAELIKELISAGDFKPFRYAAKKNYLNIMQKMWDWSSVDARAQMLASGDNYTDIHDQWDDGKACKKAYYGGFQVFRIAAESGNLIMLDTLYKWASTEEEKVLMLEAGDYKAFRLASGHGHLEIIRKIYGWTSEDDRSFLISSTDYFSFRVASEKGHLKIIQQLFDWSNKKNRSEMIKSVNYYSFKLALQNNHHEVVQQLLKWGKPVDMLAMKFIQYPKRESCIVS